jgi:hypothetical protein
MGWLSVPPGFKEEAEWFDENYEQLTQHVDLIRDHSGDMGWMKELVSERSVAPLAEGLL